MGSVFAKQTNTSLYSVDGVEYSIDLVYDAEQHCTIDLIERQVGGEKLRKQTKSCVNENTGKTLEMIPMGQRRHISCPLVTANFVT